ncbi:class I SAM-dependent methyltransferase [Streptomyces sp. NPDC047000]|uniref:class I SAM-dependent methyltransferase n=1 Tax=Streptomyces sp. NPDC047000 TaxID=3155474 RepID=UPI0034004BF8
MTHATNVPDTTATTDAAPAADPATTAGDTASAASVGITAAARATATVTGSSATTPAAQAGAPGTAEPLGGGTDGAAGRAGTARTTGTAGTAGVPGTAGTLRTAPDTTGTPGAAPGTAPVAARDAASAVTGPRTAATPAGQASSAEDPRFLDTTRAAYDTIARDYTAEHPDSTAGPTAHLERALLGTFAELVREHSDAPVADIGSGPGYVTARLAGLGLPVFGVDVSPQMVATAREAHPELRFHVGSMTALDLPDGTLGGVLALYSTIHVPDRHLPSAFAEFHRVLVPGGYVLLAFQTVPEDSGERHVHLDERYGHAISLDYHWRTPETIGALLADTGFHVLARVHREPWGDEKRPRGFVLARGR